METVYKVARYRANGRHVSVIAKDRHALFYEVGKHVIPRVGKIFAFDTRRHAEQWIANIQREPSYLCLFINLCLFEATTSGWRKAPHTIPLIDTLTDLEVKEWWSNRKDVPEAAFSPDGTVLCDDLTLVRRLWRGAVVNYSPYIVSG